MPSRPSPRGARWARLALAVTLLVLAGVARAGQRFDVRNYGARGDGEADDGPAIRAAIAALEAASGGELFFPPGTYLVASRSSRFGGWAALQMVFATPNSEPVRIVGQGATLRHRAGEGQALLAVGAHLTGRPWELERWPVHDLEISGLAFEGTRHPTDRDIEATQGNTLLHLTWVEGVRVSGCRFARSNGAGLYFFARDARFEDNVFEDANGGLQGNMSRGVQITGNTFRCGAKCDDQIGIFGGAGTAGSGAVRIAGNTVEKGWDGRGRAGGSRRGWARCMVVGGNAAGIEIQGNRCTNLGSVARVDVNAPSALSGLVLEAGRGGAPRDVQVEGNRFENLWGYGLVAVDVPLVGLAVRGNAFLDLGGGAVALQMPVGRGRMRGLSIEGNSFKAVAGAGVGAVVRVEAADAMEVTRNTFQACPADALVVAGWSTGRATVTGNEVTAGASDVRGALFRLDDAAEAVVTGNHVSAPGRELLSVGAGTRRVEVRDNEGP